MAYWLIKSEPFKYSWEQFEADKHTFWDGVRNYAARNNLKAMKKGDLAFYYHSNEGPDDQRSFVRWCNRHPREPRLS